MWPFNKKQPVQEPAQVKKPFDFLTHDHMGNGASKWSELLDTIKENLPKVDGVAMDSAYSGKDVFANGIPNYPDALVSWFSSQSFVGHQLSSILAQHWLIDKACDVPARDAVRHGFSVQIAGLDEDNNTKQTEIVKDIEKADKKYRLKHHLKQFVRFGRVFGIRIALFEVKSNDPKYYENPFNPDGVTKGSYKGIRQIDPYWCTPVLDTLAASEPTSSGFYEPTYWIINNKKYHKSHLCIFKNSDVTDLLKPLYFYGGVPVPQRIMERVYAAERTANEAPLLAMSKRLMVWNTDLQSIATNQDKFADHMEMFIANRDNFGIKLVNNDDTVQQFETSLADVDTVTMSQYQLVAAAANIPVTKLLGTTPKGFNATGEYDESSYHEELESIQANDLQELVDRHHELLLRSEIAPKFSLNVDKVEVVIDWAALDSPTAKEYAEINEIQSRTDANLVNAGAIDGMDIRDRLVNDPNSGYASLKQIDEDEAPTPPTEQITTAGGSYGSE